jgi:phage tail-like protein
MAATAENKKEYSIIEDRSTIATDPLRAFRYRATFKAANGAEKAFDPRVTSFSGGFNSISGMGISIGVSEYREGGYNTTSHKIPGQASFGAVTFSRGALYGTDSAQAWMRGLFAAASGDGLPLSGNNGGAFRCNVMVYLMEHPNTGTTNTPRMAFFIHNAWISSLQYSGLDASTSGLMMETMTLENEGISMGYIKVSSGGAVSGYGDFVIPPGFKS